MVSPLHRSSTRDKTSGHRKSPKRLRSTSPKSRKMKNSSARASSPKMVKSRSSESRSPSPRTRRLMRVQVEREAARASERDHEKNKGRGSDKAKYREKDSNRNDQIERRERRSGRDSYTNGSSKSRSERSASPTDSSHTRQHRSRSPAATNRRDRDETGGDDHRNYDNDSVAKMKEAEEALQAKEKEKPSFELSGKLAAETNRVRGITLLFNEPPDARMPTIRWRLYVLKNGELFNGGNGGLQTFPHITHLAASNTLFFSTGKLRRRTLMALLLRK